MGGGEIVADGQGKLVDNFCGMWRDDSGADEDTLFISDQLDEALTEVAGVAAGHDGKGC